MEQKLLEAGEIVGTHGVRGEVKIQPWCDAPEFLCGFDIFYLDGAPVRVRSARAHGNNVLAALEGTEDVNAAMRLRGKTVCIDRTGLNLPEGRYFIADLVGLSVLDAETGDTLGRLEEVLTLPANDVYVVRGARRYMIPAVPAFIAEVDLPGGVLRVRLIEGMADDAD